MSDQTHIRILIAKPGLDGHDRGAKIVARALMDAGFEVVYTGLHKTPEQIVESALQEDVDYVGLSILSGAHMTVFAKVKELMAAQGLADIPLFGGGIIPDDDKAKLLDMGVDAIFGPGTSTKDVVEWVREHSGLPKEAGVPA